MNQHKILWDNLKYFKKMKWITQTELAQEMQTTQEVLSNIERWNVNPCLDLISRIAYWLDIKPEVLLSESPHKTLIENTYHQNYIIAKLYEHWLDEYDWGRISDSVYKAIFNF